MSLRVIPISRNLRMNARFLGLEVEDLFIISFIAIFFLIVGQFIFPKLPFMGVPVASIVFRCCSGSQMK